MAELNLNLPIPVSPSRAWGPDLNTALGAVQDAIRVTPRPVQLDVRDGPGVQLGGVVDSTTGAQAVIDACQAAGGGQVVIPGRLKVSSLTHRPGVELKGVGSAFGDLTASPSAIVGTAGVDTIVFGGSGYTEQYKITDLAVSGGRRAIAILGQGVTNLSVRDAKLSGSEAGFYFDTWIERCNFDRVEFAGGQYGLRMVDNGTINNYMDKTAFTNIRCTSQSLNGFRIDSNRQCNLNLFENIVFNGCGREALKVGAFLTQATFINASTEVTGTSGPAFASTTGTVSMGSAALTVASATNLVVGQAITVRGAGASGLDLFTTISAISGTAITMANAASVGVTGTEVNNGIYDDFAFSTDGFSNVTFINCFPGGGGELDRIRYAVSGGLYGTFIGSSWNRPVNNASMQNTFVNSTGPIVEPATLNTTPRALRKLNLGSYGRRAVVPGIPGSGLVISGRGAGHADENVGPYGGVDFVRTDPNRTRVARIDFDTGELILGQGALYEENGALKYRGFNGTVTTVAPS